MEERRGRAAARRQVSAKRGSPAYAEPPETKPLGLEEAGVPFGGLVPAPPERRVKLFKNGRSQAVRIPREFELPGKEAIMRKEGERLIIEPAPKRSLIELLETLDPIDEEFPPIEDMPPEPVDL